MNYVIVCCKLFVVCSKLFVIYNVCDVHCVLIIVYVVDCVSCGSWFVLYILCCGLYVVCYLL